jgi:hypothetical protein
MATLFLRRSPGASSGDLIDKLGSRLAHAGIRRHPGTLYRQLSGFTRAVPTEMESAMRRVLIASNGMRTLSDIERALTQAGLQVPVFRRAPPFLPVKRTLPLYHLWLHLNPSLSKKDLATRLHKDLARDGVRANAPSLPSILEGRRGFPRREVLEKLLAYLKEHGIASEAEALKRARSKEVRRSVEGRGFAPIRDFVRLCRVWQLRHHEPSLRRLAWRLREEMSRRGVSMALPQYQKLVDGQFQHIRRSILWAMEDMIRKALPPARDLKAEVDKALSDTEKFAVLQWVQAGPIAELSRKWISEHPGIRERALAVRTYKTARRMGYACTLYTIQCILGGRRKKTRGFIYRAMLKQFGRGPARIPVEHLITAGQRAGTGMEAPGIHDAGTAGKNRSGTRARRRSPVPTELESSIQEARRYLRASPRSEHLEDFLAFRIACSHEVSRDRATAMLMSRESDVPDEAGSDAGIPQGGPGEALPGAKPPGNPAS